MFKRVSGVVLLAFVASVAAAWATDIENRSPTSARARPKMRTVSTAAMALPKIKPATNPSARRIVDHSNMTSGSKSNPTDTRKVGMKKALPKKVLLLIVATLVLWRLGHMLAASLWAFGHPRGGAPLPRSVNLGLLPVALAVARWLLPRRKAST